MNKTFLFFVAFVAFFVLPLAAPAFDFFEPVQPPRPFQVMVHRGAASQAPENTRPAIEHCIADQFEWVEVDVRLTKDGHHVICHDDTVDRMTNGSGRVDGLTLDEIKQLDAGNWFAPRYSTERLLTLEECLTLAKGKINLYLDCKAIDPKQLVREIIKAGMETQVVVYDDLVNVTTIREKSKGKVAVMAKWRPEDGMGGALAQWRLDAVEIDAEYITAEVCDAFHKRGIRVQANVLGERDRPERWDSVLDAGADWIQTDLPEEIIAHRLWKALPERPVQISCHRGANRYAPENTIPAFEKAIRLGVDYVEIDVRTTTDGQYFLLHDGKLDRTTNGTGPFGERDSSYIRTLDAGLWFGKPFAGVPLPTLDDTLKLLGGKSKVYFDAKDIAADVLVRKLEEANLVDDTVVYDGPEYLIQLKAFNPAIRPLCPLGDPNAIDTLCDKVQPYAFDTSWEILSKELIDHCHARGVKVFSDAMGRERIEEYTKAIEWGIDLIQTDHPLRVMRAVELLQRPTTAAPK